MAVVLLEHHVTVCYSYTMGILPKEDYHSVIETLLKKESCQLYSESLRSIGFVSSLLYFHLGHTKLILCFTDCLGRKHDPVGRQKNKNKNDQTSHKFN